MRVERIYERITCTLCALCPSFAKTSLYPKFRFSAFKFWCVYVLYLLFVAIITAIVDLKPFFYLSLQVATFFSHRWPPFEKFTRKKTYSFASHSRSKLCECKRKCSPSIEQKLWTLFESEFMFIVLKISVLNTYTVYDGWRCSGGRGVVCVQTEKLQPVSFPCGHRKWRGEWGSIHGCKCKWSHHEKRTQMLLRNST